MKNAFNNEILNSFSSVNKLLYNLAKADAEKNGLTVVQLKALYKLSSHPNIGLVELAEHLKLTNSTVSGVVERLVKHGLVERKHDPHDRRAITLNLTPQCEEKLERVIETESVFVKKLNLIEERLTEEQLNQLFALHSQISDILSE
ncbi:MarR family transcriptional regulator [Aciduricibacillus chroicocephali]|uniref:MarR family transcriptional regulator n=1 Tax=Aciduricibacillus chroicocephali TaxID=3054939 RepID=A0ABY9KUM2_9BACI|nr:MarR family transcriptional regulator [Bacillaceae bacterium 44XB]